ncbi:MAG: sulfite exporter TauE/SafE family protein [Desulfobacterales bacterium]|nr:sulfite exporter TauE/SafE family protein [Desulfobacterales bacterium]
MQTVDLSSMFLLGLLGTGHCLGMCGPLVFALPGQTGRFRDHLAYHAGRLGTYALVGGVVGGLGGVVRFLAGRAAADPLTGVAAAQIGFGLLAGVLLAVLGLARLGLIREPLWMTGGGLARLPGIGALLRRAGQGTTAAMLVSGAVMGFLPCGLSFGAFSRALAIDDPFQGAALTLAFGLGTLPGLLLLGSGLAPLIRRFRRHSDILAGILMMGMAAALVVKSATAIGI